MEFHTPKPYSRHAGGGGAHMSRSSRSKGHVASLSCSSIDDLTPMPLSLTPQQNETGDDTLAIAPENAVEPTHSKIQGFSSWNFLPRRVRPFSFRKVVIFCLASALVGSAWLSTWEPEKSINLETPVIDAYVPPMPHPPAGYTIQADTSHPIQWLRKNTILDLQDLPTQQVQALIETRPKAAFISLVRNEEVEEMVASILQVEARFNSRETHGYDWVFFNNEEFTEEFKAIVSGATDSQCYFERIPQEHWRIPSWIDINRFDIGRQFMGGIGVGKAWLQSYHHMCRWNAGIFASEKRLANYDWFWRVEPAVQFSCDINYDVFRFMQDNNMAYGFNMAILDDARSFPSLWERTKEFIDHNEELVDEDADFNWLLYTAEDHDDVIRPHTGAKEGLGDGEYNNCQFYSNFEIGSLKFFRSKEHMAYFDHLDKAGGFYYERFGDAPVHTLSVSMFLPKSRIWYFRDIGYAHGLCEQCPPHEHPLASRLQRKALLPQEVEQEVSKPIKDDTRTMMEGPFESFGSKHRRWTTMAQDVERQKGIPSLACGCTVNAIDSNNAKLVPYESKQRKPSDPCIRKFLGGKWLVKKDKVSDFNSDTGIIRSSDSVEYVLDGRDGNPFQ